MALLLGVGSGDDRPVTNVKWPGSGTYIGKKLKQWEKQRTEGAAFPERWVGWPLQQGRRGCGRKPCGVAVGAQRPMQSSEEASRVRMDLGPVRDGETSISVLEGEALPGKWETGGGGVPGLLPPSLSPFHN